MGGSEGGKVPFPLRYLMAVERGETDKALPAQRCGAEPALQQFGRQLT